jgi:inorganic pyrophosphatase
MDVSKIPTGKNPPYDCNAIIEIPQHGEPVKYEMDKASGALFVDRFLHTAMFYPGNYGFIPHTLSDDGDPVDVLVVGPTPVAPGAVVRCRPIGALLMEDEAGGDEKILAVPVDALHPFYVDVSSWRQLPAILTEQIAHFFLHYKDLEKGKETRIPRLGRRGGGRRAHPPLDHAQRRSRGRGPHVSDRAALLRAVGLATHPPTFNSASSG